MYFVDESLIASGRVIPAGSKVNEAIAPPAVIADLKAVMAAGGAVRYEAEPGKVTRDDSAAPQTAAAKATGKPKKDPRTVEPGTKAGGD
jgi:phage terminase large subunit-like protein